MTNIMTMNAEITTPSSTTVMIDHFQPLTLIHMQQIMALVGQVDELHLLITPHPSPNPNFEITLADKARWLQMACVDLPFIHIHTTTSVVGIENMDGVDAIDSVMAEFVSVMSDDASNKDLAQIKIYVNAETVGMADAIDSDAVKTTGQRVHYLPKITDTSHEQIHANPANHWHIIHPQARSSYTKTVAIVGGESSGKTTLLHKLVNHYGASYALEMGRLYVETDLGGSEVGLQYSDYVPIALDHAQAIREAVYQADAPVTFVDTDFVTTQAFCEEYEGRTHPFLTACIETFRLDHTIMLDNNTPWIADGMRSLGSDDDRNRFESRLNEIFARHGIETHHINNAEYHQRYLSAVAFVDKVVFGL